MKTSQQLQAMCGELLDWYVQQDRTLPWRIRPEDRAAGRAVDPYKVWLSEIMCQQTTTNAAAAYWYKFLDKWPGVQDLAAAPRDDIMGAWAGLGYYARARNLHKCAQIICADYNGVFPKTEAELLKLPGIGPYSAAAIAAICYKEASNVVDGNVERVISRIFRVQEKLPKAKPVLRNLAATLAGAFSHSGSHVGSYLGHPGDYAQGLMDLGAHICKPKNPKCNLCPWQGHCLAFATGDPENYPKRKPKPERPSRYGAVFYVEQDGYIWLRRRPDKGLLGGMMELPGTDWSVGKPNVETWLSQAPLKGDWQPIEGEIVHVFTHFTLYLTVFTAQVRSSGFAISADVNRLDDYALPSLMRKAIAKAARL